MELFLFSARKRYGYNSHLLIMPTVNYNDDNLLSIQVNMD